MLTDTHCHLADPVFGGRTDAVLAQARAAGVARFLVPSARAEDFAAVAALHRPPQIYGALGVHPWYAEEWRAEAGERMAAVLRAQPKMWVGEIGLDYHPRHRANAALQLAVLRAQLALAAQLGRPVVLHNLKATADLAAELKRQRFQAGGIAHAFSGSLEEAKLLIGCGLLIGIGTLVLRPNARKVREAAAKLPLEHLVLETDSPFMPPWGEAENTPANVCRVADEVAALRGISREAVAAATEANIGRLLAPA
ncbi:MAG: TatD family hydrolase [Eikenella sp.]|nr:TatD family hydrolase [Eikenella sp.]